MSLLNYEICKVLSNSQSLNQYLEEQVRLQLTGLIELMLEIEVSELLCRKKYQRLKDTQDKRGYRKGYRNRYFLTIYSMMLSIKVPRTRGKKYIPVLFRDKGIMEPAMEKMLLLLWSDSISYRDIRNFVKSIYGSAISLGFISRMVKKIDEYVKKFPSREINRKYDCIYIDGLEISIKDQEPRNPHSYYKGRKIGKNMVVLAVLGQRREGRKIIREVIDYRIKLRKNEESYTELLRSLRNRGLKGEQIKLIVHDGEFSIRKGMKNVYGKEKIPEQICMFHKMENILSVLEEKKNKDQIQKDIWSVYSSGTEKEYEEKKSEIIEKWESKEPKATEMLMKSDKELKTKYKFSKHVHKSIHTNNPIERYFRELRRRTKVIGIFESVSSADRLLFLMIESINQRRGSHRRGCKKNCVND